MSSGNGHDHPDSGTERSTDDGLFGSAQGKKGADEAAKVSQVPPQGFDDLSFEDAIEEGESTDPHLDG